ncbi:MAG: molybdopterin molybdotransferase MoeA [Planctomycetales bacterium]|nr:molybdopterin molybdotransferase MoeA [Planctomycetales bacterium]
MLSVDEALQKVLHQVQPTNIAHMPVLDALGHSLAEEVASDVDSPPHTKALMDGYAVIAADVQRPGAVLTVLEEVVAGQVPQRTVAPGCATRIMTGAPIPPGADAVVMIEETRVIETQGQLPAQVEINSDRVRPGANLLRQAASIACGQTVLRPGALLRPMEVGVLSEVGRTSVDVFCRPRVAVMTSGDELVTPDRKPAAGQIRNSNNPMLVALARRAGATALDLGVARDDAAAIQEMAESGLKHDALVLSGGVSAGVRDLVPQALAACQVAQVFHKVNLKPGKPMWFGIAERDGRKTLVFGLPGNPVGALVCFELFVRPALLAMQQLAESPARTVGARLTTSFSHRGDRPTYFPAAIDAAPRGDGLPAVRPLPWQGSADLFTLAKANALIQFSAGDRDYPPEEIVPVRLLDGA